MMINQMYLSAAKFLGYDINHAMIRLARIRNLTFEEKAKWRIQKRWDIVKHHFDKNTFYRSKLGERLPNNWDDLPILNKSDFQNSIENLLSEGFSKKNTYISSTSGSSGAPFFFAKDKYCHSLSWANIINRYQKLGIRFRALEARFYGIPLDEKQYKIEILKDFFMNRVRFKIFDLSDPAMRDFVILLNKKRYVYIYGYTNSIVAFAKYIIRNNISIKDICPSLKLIIVTSELLFHDDRKLLVNAFKLPVYSEYGSSEFGYIGKEVHPEKWQVVDELLHVENDLDGNIIITDLNNKAFPFIKYNIGDRGEVFQNASGKIYIRKLTGRINDQILLPSGRKSPGLTFYYISRSILEKTTDIKEFIIIQKELDLFVFEIVSTKHITDKIVMELRKQMDLYLEKGLRLKINRVKAIDRPIGGKLKHFYSCI